MGAVHEKTANTRRNSQLSVYKSGTLTPRPRTTTVKNELMLMIR